MMEEVNASEEKALVTVGVESGVKKVGEHAADRAINALVNFVGNKYQKAQVLTKSVYKKYLENAYKRYNQVKTLVTAHEPRTIIGRDSIYINVGISYQGKEINTATVEHMLEISKNILITGTGGIGKSMLMRYLFLNTADDGCYVPVLLEVRKISTQASGSISILDLIYSCMKDYDVQMPKEQFEYSLRHGDYLFLFDGFDEVKEEQATETAEAIQKFCSKYPDNACIITSRPSRDFSTFETFTQVESMMLSKEQAVSLAGKFWPTSEKTEDFCRQLEETLFEKHQDFAENPLLLSMMFLTFMDNNFVPDHLADFYEKSYEALYRIHDSRNKGIFRRDFRCKSLEERQFKLLFADFCFRTYFEEQYEFVEADILKLLERSIEKRGFTGVSAGDYLSDLRHAVCLIVKDGSIYRFAHRSFQAYFAAYYTTNVVSDEQQKQLFDYFLKSEFYSEKEDYYQLLCQMEPERFAINALEDGLRKLQRDWEKVSDQNEFFVKKRCCGYKIKEFENGYQFMTRVGDEHYYTLGVMDLHSKYILKEIRRKCKQEYNTVVSEIKSLTGKVALISDLNNIYDIYEFDEVDKSPNLTEGERRRLYECLAQMSGMPKIREDIFQWLEKMDHKRQALKSKDFIDSL